MSESITTATAAKLSTSTPGASLEGFAYGEHLEGLPPRSLGYRLLAPLEPAPWSAEVEGLARRLQGAPYPDHWPPTDLFCSVFLADGRRLIALARYGLADHTPSQRRGGLELIGVLVPADLDVASALAIYRWLQTRRAQSDNLHALGGHFALADALAAGTPPPPADPVPVLPIRLWQEGALLFAAPAPSDPDHRLGLLDQGAGRAWQWLPLVGPDFPLAAYAQRGPLVAWTPHLAGIAVKVDRKHPEDVHRPARPSRFLVFCGVLLLFLLTVLSASVLWQMLSLRSQVAALAVPPIATQSEGPAARPSPELPAAPDDSRERFADALHDLLQSRMKSEWEKARPHLLAAYERAAASRPELRLKENDVKGREALGAVLLLSGRSADRVDEAVRTALSNKGYDPALIKTAAERVRQQLLDDLKDGPP
jgi:hypothetical protein